MFTVSKVSQSVLYKMFAQSTTKKDNTKLVFAFNCFILKHSLHRNKVCNSFFFFFLHI